MHGVLVTRGSRPRCAVVSAEGCSSEGDLMNRPMSSVYKDDLHLGYRSIVFASIGVLTSMFWEQ